MEPNLAEQEFPAPLDRRLPRVWKPNASYMVFSSNWKRLGRLERLEHVERLLAEDRNAFVRNGNHAYIQLADDDAWAAMTRVAFQKCRPFLPIDYVPDTYVSREHGYTFEPWPSPECPRARRN